nr:putative RNA-dependent RNA polymerase [Rhizoctonia solani partitivirus 15]
MDSLLTSLSQLSINSNLEFIGYDPHHGSVPQMNKSHNDWFFACRALVVSTICMYAFFFNLQTVQRVLYDYRRPHPTPEKAEEFFLRYDVNKHQILKDEHYWKALLIVTEWFRPRWKIHPVHFTDLRWYPWNKNTSAERPFTTEPFYKTYVQYWFKQNWLLDGKLSFRNLENHIWLRIRPMLHRIKRGLTVAIPPITLHVKPALVFDIVDKVRTVFGVSKLVIFIEAMFFWPLFSHYFTICKTPLLWNYESLNGGWHRLNAEYRSRYTSFKPVFNLDWSEYDMHIYFDMWKDCFDSVSSYFCFCGCYCPTNPGVAQGSGYPKPRTKPEYIFNLWKWIWTAYTSMLCISPTGKVFKRLFAGMPSGIFCTQFWDSFYNCVMVVTILLSLGYEIHPDHFLKVMGDDVLFGLLTMIPISEWAEFLDAFADEAKRRFNMKLSPSKCGASETIQGASVLSYSNNNGWPVRDPETLLAQLLNPKSLKDTFPRLMARAIGIYYASAGSPKLRPICKHIYDELKHQGFEPHHRVIYEMFGHLPETVSFISLDHFPSEVEVLSRISRPSGRSDELQSQYWNREHFIFESGLAPHCDEMTN